MRRLTANFAQRCPRCLLTRRWCVCPAHREVRCALAVDVLMHPREQFRPTSTGHLIRRVLPDSRQHVWTRERSLAADAVRRPGRELWVLHPHGQPPPIESSPEQVQVLLLDGVWSEATAMAQAVAGWGRLVALPMQGTSRFWLRTQQDGGRFSTVESLLFLLQTFGLREAHDELRLQFELHVYASLRARGRRDLAEHFLDGSPAAKAFAGFLAQLHARRPLAPPPP
ncbi:MAG: DTW domain-containing protein [Verrucomicrobia bacterium]|nr:DTW domain-containing protein [Verrucomicrobiota bacterium]